jgi:hypothetical protein
MLVRILVTAALAAGLACAQGRGIGDMGGEGPGGGTGNGGMGGRGMGGEEMGGGMPRAAQRQTKPELLMEKLKLNKDQKEEATKILSEAAEKARPVANQILNGRQQIASAILQKKTDQEMKPLMDAYTGVCAQMTAIEADAFGKIYATLKPNQQKNAAQAFELMSGIFMPAQGGGRGAGRGMARAGRN